MGDGFTLPTKRTRRTSKKTENRDRFRTTRRDGGKTFRYKNDFNEQETPDPLITKPRDPRLKLLTHDKPTDFDQNWTTDRIIAQLPKKFPHHS